MGNGRSQTSEDVLSMSDKLLLRESVEDPNAASTDDRMIRQLILHCSEKLDDAIFSVKKGSVLRFILGPSLCNISVRLFISDQSVGVEEEQSLYELTWHRKHSHEFGSFSDNVQILADVQATVAGSFRYFFTVNGTSHAGDASGSGYFIVQPELTVGSLKTNVPLHGIVCQTVLSKNLGPFSGWLERLIVAKNTGYNAIHFTPLQVGDYYMFNMFSKSQYTTWFANRFI